MPFGIGVFEIVALVLACLFIGVLGAIVFLLTRKVMKYLERR